MYVEAIPDQTHLSSEELGHHWLAGWLAYLVKEVALRGRCRPYELAEFDCSPME